MRSRGRKVLAVLAGGVVLLGGGVTTLASWQDEAYDQVPLALSRFNLQQTVDETAWVEADTQGTASQLSLTVAGATTNPLTPGGSATAWVGLRVDGGSIGGTVTMSGATIGADTAALAPRVTYQALAGVSRAQCAAGSMPATGTVVLAPAGSRLDTASSTAFRVEAGIGGAAGPMTGVCLKLSLEAGIGRSFGGTSISPVWRFGATSDG